MVVKTDLVSYLSQINWTDYDLAVLVGMINPIYAAKLNISEIPIPVLIELENSPRLSKRIFQSTLNREDIAYFGDRQGIAYNDGIPLSRFYVMPVAFDFYNSEVVAPSLDRLLYAGRIAKENSIDVIAKHFGEDIDYYGKAVQKAHKAWFGDRYHGTFDPRTFYKDTACKYLGAVTATNEPGIAHENIEAMLAGLPIVVLNDEVWNSYDSDFIYGHIEADGRFRTCAISGYGFKPDELLDALQEHYSSVERRKKIRDHALTMTVEVNGFKLKDMIDRVFGKKGAVSRPPLQAVPTNGGENLAASNASEEEEDEDLDDDSADAVAQLAEEQDQEERPEAPAE